ncbi:MAG: protein kinase [Deltaproteobacteria bacterium]|nr:protein kinase [Deltaproteobacteria bacterium]
MTRPDVASAEMVGPYRVIKAIGGGGSARIDLARIERAYGFERDVVLKRPLEHLRSSPAVAASLRREASLGGRLGHPNIVAVLDAGEHDGYDYLVLEHIRGMSLRAAIEAAPGAVAMFPLDAALSIVIAVASGLEFAHELAGADGLPLGLVHRDVSPANVLLGRDGTVKLADFGIAKDTHVDTLSGSLRGTVTYMSPEQCRGHAFDRRADVFSLGVILHELITGRRLFWADNDVASLHRVLSGAIPDPRELVPSIASELATTVMGALAHDASDRIPSAKHLAELLESFATRAGVLIGARRIERAFHAAATPSPASSRSDNRLSISAAVTAPRSIAEPSPTKPMHVLSMRPSIEEPSLVSVIESSPDLDDPTDPSSEPAMHAPPLEPQRPARSISIVERVLEPTTEPPRALQPSPPASELSASTPPSTPPSIDRTRRRDLAIVLGVSITLGVTIAVLVLQRSPSFDPAENPRVIAPASVTKQVAEPPAPSPESEAIAPISEPEAVAPPIPDSAIEDPAPAPIPGRVRVRPRPARANPPKPPVAPAGSNTARGSNPTTGSNAAPEPRKKIQWNEKIVLPGDPASGSAR